MATFFFTVSTPWGLLIRITLDFVWLGATVVGLGAGFRFANRSSLAELGIPSSAFVSEPSLRNKKLLALVFFGVLVATALFNASREPDLIGRLFWTLTAFLYGLPLRWFVLNVGINALVLIVIYRQSVRRQTRIECAEPRLHSLAPQDKERIQILVRIPWIAYHPHLDEDGPYIDFVFGIFNNSLFDIQIDNLITKGEIWCEPDNKDLHYPPKMKADQPIRCGSRSGSHLVIRQALRFQEIPRFKGKDYVIGFGSLVINFQGTEDFSQIGPTRLNTNHWLETKKGGWSNPNQPEQFAFAYTDKQWALLSVSNTQEVAILKAETDSLKTQLLDHTGDEPQRLRAIGQRDSVTLSSAVFVHHCEIEYELSDSVPHIEFRFDLFNGSVYEISVLDSIPQGSYVKFRKQRLMGEKAIARNDATKIGHVSSGRFWVRYQLSREEADLIGNARAPNMDYFYFDKLQIQIISTGIEAQPLRLPHAIPSSIGRDADAKLQEQVESLRSEIAVLRAPKLTFDIAGESTQVNLRRKRIEVSVKLRCLKVSEGKMAVREFRASLPKESPEGEQAVVGSVIAERAWYFAKDSTPRGIADKDLDISNGLVVTEPISPYYWFFFYLNLSPQIEGSLSGDHFVQVTMNALGQDPVSIDFYADNWNDARQSNSYVTLR